MKENTDGTTTTCLNQVISIDQGRIQQHLDTMVRTTVEETLNAFLDAEADRLCKAKRYERTEARVDTRAGHYERGLHTKAGEVIPNFEVNFRNGDYRAVSSQRGQCGGSAH